MPRYTEHVLGVLEGLFRVLAKLEEKGDIIVSRATLLEILKIAEEILSALINYLEAQKLKKE